MHKRARPKAAMSVCVPVSKYDIIDQESQNYEETSLPPFTLKPPNEGNLGKMHNYYFQESITVGLLLFFIFS